MALKRFIIVVALVGGAASAAGAQNYRDTLTALLQSIRTQYKLAGISVAAIRNGSIVAVGGAGTADIGRNVPVTDSTMYRIASISKTVTAMALMQLYEQGRFVLDDDVSWFLPFSLRNPSYPDVPITFRMLLSHTSSVQDGTGYDGFLSASGGKNPPPLSSVLVPGGTYYTANIWRSNRPGAYFAYSNLGFCIVGTLVEAISGERFDQYCLNHIFRPLGIDAGFNVADLRGIGNVAVLYRTSGGSWVPQADNFGGVPQPQRDLSAYTIGTNGAVFGPQGGLRISARDLAKIVVARMRGGEVSGVRLLQDSTVRLMAAPVWTYNGSNGDNYYGLFRQWGLGTHLTTNASMGDIVIPGKAMAGHPGEAYGLISDAYWETSSGELGIVFLTNGRDGAYQFGSTSAFYDVEEAVFTKTAAMIRSMTTAVGRPVGSVPTGLHLEQNYPNPFNPTTTIRFSTDGEHPVRVRVVDLIGREVAVLFSGRTAAGEHTVSFDGAPLSGGVYLCLLESGSSRLLRSMVLLK